MTVQELQKQVKAPIVHGKFFLTEYDLFGYKPLFSPNPVTFDSKNRPYIVKYNADDRGSDDATRDGWVQTLDPSSGAWLQFRFTDCIRAQYPTWNGLFSSGSYFENVVRFDASDTAHLIVCILRTNPLQKLLWLTSSDFCRTWRIAADLPHRFFSTSPAFEMPDSHTDPSRVVAVINTRGFNPGPLVLALPDGTSIDLGFCGLAAPKHSGGGNMCVTHRGLTYAVFLSMESAKDTCTGQKLPGTAQYVIAYDHTKRATIGPARLLGANGVGCPDGHNAPAITIDSAGVLHVLLGCHHQHFLYMHSLRPRDVTAWSQPEPIGGEVSNGGYTYVALLCDVEDTLHVVGRYAGERYTFCLDYLRKRKGHAWENRGHLVVPCRDMYARWDHKLTMDRRGRLFLFYQYYVNQLGWDQGATVRGVVQTAASPDVVAYRKKWPTEHLGRKKDGSPAEVRDPGGWWNTRPHDPVILMSDNGGNEWRLATTRNFAAKCI